jgi:hypothetical protein
VSKVNPDGIVISDYHSPKKARRILQDVCHLSNPLICTEDGKATGAVWEKLKPDHHLGDNLHSDFRSPMKYGIPATICREWEQTAEEIACGDLGWVMREARLTTYHANPAIRGLQLHQIERNFPFLYAVAHIIRTKMLTGGYTRLLLCSRDCLQLFQMMSKLFSHEPYEIDYFYTSRLTRYRPSDVYAKYAQERLSGNTLIVDMNGTGNSLKYLTDRFGGTPLLVCGIGASVPVIAVSGIRETSNPANHPMICDVATTDSVSYPWIPIYINPANVSWNKPEIVEGYRALMHAVDCIQYHGSIIPSYTPESVLRNMVNDPALEPLWADHLKDSKAAFDLLNSGPLPHAVIL